MPVYKDVGIDTDGDGTPDRVDQDDDNDGIFDIDDGCPLDINNICIVATDTVTVNGRVWVQPDLFLNLTWNEINAVCPLGICIEGGVLNGHDMTGLVWASIEDVNALLNDYIIGSPFGAGPFTTNEISNANLQRLFTADGWRGFIYLPLSALIFEGWLVTPVADIYGTIYRPLVGVVEYSDRSNFYTNGLALPIPEEAREYRGAWFYRSN